MHGRTSRIAFHWATVLLLAVSYLTMLYRDGMDDPDQRLLWLDVHRSIGLAILAITLIRLLVRLVARSPGVSLSLSPALTWASRISHAALYLGLLAMPLLGWAQSSAKMRHFKVFDVALPAIVAHDADLGERIGEWHETLAWCLLGLIALHSLAALYHHYIRRDDVLRDMLPGGRPATARR